MTKYVQKPIGWWQDSKGRAQPPGSFLDPSLRTTAESASGTSARPAAPMWARRLVGAIRRRAE